MSVRGDLKIERYSNQNVDFAQSDVALASAGDPFGKKPPAEAGATSISIMA
jgi:hypothetical protein